MPELTVYAKIRRSRKKRAHKWKIIPVFRMHQQPVSWYDLKDTLIEVAKQIYLDHQQTETAISVERHLAGRYIRAMQLYHDAKVRTNRMPEFRAVIIYKPKIENIEIKSALLISPEYFFNFRFDYQIDTKKKWQLKKVIPSGFAALLLNPDSIFINQIAVKTPNYGDQQPMELYSTMQEKHQSLGCYEALPHGVYGSNDSTLEIDKAERRSRFRG